VKWSYGITTVPQRLGTTLPKTIASLAAAGFDKPQLFIDGPSSGFESFNLPMTSHSPGVRVFGNWYLALLELYVREPGASRYAIFQDDIIACRNLKDYLDKVPYPDKGYWNLYTVPKNQERMPKTGATGFYLSNQMGRGALALVFDRITVTTLLSQPDFVQHPQDVTGGWRNVDGSVVTSLAKASWKEYVHHPSLVQHTGIDSSIGNAYKADAESFPGETFNALELLQC
jgi:hypothetical protein